jgi:predicted O-methyltransferase YrrM
MMQYEQVSDYVKRLVGEGDAVLSQAYRKSIELRPYGVIPIDSSRGRLLELIARMTNPKRVLEIGPGGGYSGLWFFKGMKKTSKLEVIEHHPYVAAEFAKVMRNAGFGNRITIHLGPALEVLPHLKGYFDCVFIDADKDEYPSYLNHSMRLTHVGSIILADNLLWGGSVLGAKHREGETGIIEYTKMIFRDRRLRSLIIPLGDGLGVSYRVT